MVKNIFLVTLLMIAMVSCSKEDDSLSMGGIDRYNSNSINFISQTTKAINNDIDVMEGDANGFVVYGLEINDSSWYDYLDGNGYIYNSTIELWEWESSETPSWPETFDQMNFYAFYPASATGFTLSATAPSSIVGRVVVESSILDQTDFLAACSGDVFVKPLTGMQPLRFSHIMAKVSFSVSQEAGVLTVIRQLGIENVINEGTYDYINSEWSNLSNSNLGSFDDYVGSSGVFAKTGVADQVDPIRGDGHYYMMLPQSGGVEDGQTPLWDGSIAVDDNGELVPNGAYISILYRSNNDTEDVVGYAIRESSRRQTEWDSSSSYYSAYKKNGGTYTGPLFVKAAFKFSSDQLNWVAGAEYDYTLQLNQTGGIYMSVYYYDLYGNNTKIRVSGRPKVGDTVCSTDARVLVTVNDWNSSESNLHSL
ncbi:MAG: fimbrillin family protein [Rikenellaceae bacterium]